MSTTLPGCSNLDTGQNPCNNGSIAGNGNRPGSTSIKNVLNVSKVVNDSKQFTRYFKFRSFPPFALKLFLKNKFPSIFICTGNKYWEANSFYYVLTCCFRDKTEFDSADNIDITINGQKWTLKDAKSASNSPGVFCASRVPKMFLGQVPWNMANPTCLRKVLEEFIDFQDDKITVIYDSDQSYAGRVSIIVDNFKKIPLETTKVKSLYEDGTPVGENSYVDFNIKCSGFGNVDRMKVDLVCRYCKQSGHIIKNCNVLRQKRMVNRNKCKVCNQIGTCNKSQCSNRDNICRGEIFTYSKALKQASMQQYSRAESHGEDNDGFIQVESKNAGKRKRNNLKSSGGNTSKKFNKKVNWAIEKSIDFEQSTLNDIASSKNFSTKNLMPGNCTGEDVFDQGMILNKIQSDPNNQKQMSIETDSNSLVSACKKNKQSGENIQLPNSRIVEANTAEETQNAQISLSDLKLPGKQRLPVPKVIKKAGDKINSLLPSDFNKNGQDEGIGSKQQSIEEAERKMNINMVVAEYLVSTQYDDIFIFNITTSKYVFKQAFCLKIDKEQEKCSIMCEISDASERLLATDFNTCNKFAKVLLDSDKLSKDYTFGMVGFLLTVLLKKCNPGSRKTVMLIKNLPGMDKYLTCNLVDYKHE